VTGDSDLTGPGAIWLSLGDAAKRLGVSVDAVRARVRRDRITSRRGNDGRLSVLLSDEAVTEQAVASDESGAAASRLRLDLDEARADADHWRELAHEREVKLAEAMAAVRTAETVASAEVAARERYIAQLEALLAEARRPWWRRWLA
jgi:hypothetical protein